MPDTWLRSDYAVPLKTTEDLIDTLYRQIRNDATQAMCMGFDMEKTGGFYPGYRPVSSLVDTDLIHIWADSAGVPRERTGGT